MPKEINLFDKNQLTTKYRFYILMDILVTNQGTGSRIESILMFLIFFLQFLTGFFNKRLGIYNSVNSSSDNIINWIQQVVRLRDLFTNQPLTYQVVILSFYGVLLLFTLYFIIIVLRTTKDSFYSYPEIILNFGLKCFVYICFPMILDLSIGMFCFSTTQSPLGFSSLVIVSEEICNVSINIGIKIVVVLFCLFSIVISFFIQQFYNDSLFLSTCYYSKMACRYEVYITLHSILYSLFLIEAPVFGSFPFLIYNIIASGLLFAFYFSSYIFYDHITNHIYGIFFLLYFYLSVYSLISYYIDITEKGLVYVISSLFFIIIYFNLRMKFENKLMLRTPFYQLKNKFCLLYYFKALLAKINVIDQSEEERALIIGIIQTHMKECPIDGCITKHNNPIYLPLMNQWSDRNKPFYKDKVFLLNYVLSIIKFYIDQSILFPELLINLSLYYLLVIGNYCQSILCYTKVKQLSLSLQDHFSFVRLNLAISKKMVEKLKEPNEACNQLEDLNVTFFFKYENLSQAFYSEMNKDVNLSLEFWRCFKKKDKEPIDFNYIFQLTDSIKKTKINVELLWNELYKLYNGVNELFETYLSYIECINDDDLQKRNLESIKRKAENSADNIQMNYYNIIFSKDTGIIIANGDKGKEGLIEKTNKEIETIFSYKTDELKGMNISCLMPKLLAQSHHSFMERFVQIGEKKILDNTDFKTFAKDKDNSIFLIKKLIKLLPMLNRSIFFVAIIVKEKIDDIIFIDSKYNIQGMSSVLMKKLMINNVALFQDNEIPFYVICKKFVNFNRIFLQGKKKHLKGKKKLKKGDNESEKEKKKTQSCFTIVNLDNITHINATKLDMDILQGEETTKDMMALYATGNRNANEENNDEKEESDKEDLHDDIEINENVELEYEIKIPQFIYDYSRNVSKVMTQDEFFKTQKSSFPYENLNEEDLLMTDEKSYTPLHQKSTIRNGGSSYNVIDSPYLSPSMKDLSKNLDDKREFHYKIAKHRELFEDDRFNELEDYIDLCTKNTALEFKFNFTFDKYRYGDKQIVFAIRCIDNKQEGKNLNDDSEKEEALNDVAAFKRERLGSLHPLIEIYPEEEDEINEIVQNFLLMASEDSHFKKSLCAYKEEIHKYSRVHGNQRDAVVADDEQGSQASQTGYNENLCKKTRIEEIRSNVMKNISSFYTLIYIKALVIIALLLTCAFIIVYIIILFEIYSDLNIVSDLNISFYQISYWLANTIASLISMRALFQINQNQWPFSFNSYIPNYEGYFEHLRNLSLNWNQMIESSFGLVEEKIGNFLSPDKSFFWASYKVEYTYSDIQDTETLSLSVSQVLTNINNLLRNKDYIYKGGISDDNVLNMIEYACQMAIENAFNNLLPVLYERIKTVPGLLQEYNKTSVTTFVIVIAIYGVLIFIVVVLYAVSIHLTNKNMGEGLEKITHIASEKIEDTIKKIEQFSFCLVKFMKSEKKLKSDETLSDTPKEVLQEKNICDGFSSEGRKHKKLKILLKSYTQILILFADFLLFLLLIYFYTISMIDKTNQMLSLECYYLGQTLMSSSNTLDVKCKMAECNVNFTNFVFYDIITQKQFNQMVQGLNVFSQFSTYYTNTYLLDACLTAFDKDTIEYQQCKEDPIILSTNNTPAVIQVIDEKIKEIKKEFSFYQNDASYKRMQSFGSKNFHDFEHAFYNYIITVNDRLSSVMRTSLSDYLSNTRIILLVLIVLFCVTIISSMIYIVFYFINALINLLSVSRCIMRIIPTIVIFNTPELEAWIENKY